MKRIIIVDILNEISLIEKYDNNSINHQLIEYLIKKAKNIKNTEDIKVIINNKGDTNINISKKILKGLEQELKDTIDVQYYNNFLQFILLLLGILFLFLSTTIHKNVIWEEVLIIIGWVPIWRMVNIEFIDILSLRKRKKIIRKLLKSEFMILKKEN
ncbi:MAG: hypothetical protein E7161_00030 [Firmicutes bacterium]|nr:hypothetical protein [Bacillota bacterium]